MRSFSLKILALVLISACFFYGITAVSPLASATGLKSTSPTPPSLLLNDDFIQDTREAIELLYNREFEASLDHLSKWKQAHPNHPIWPLWDAIDAWWPILIDLENTSYDDSFLTAAEQVVQYCDNLLNENPDHLDALVIRSVIYGQIARYYSNRYRWYRSFRNARRALRDFSKIEESHSHLPDLKFGIGMYRYFSSFLVDEYTLARPLRWMLPAGDRQDGLSRLKEAADSSIFVEPEATYFLGHIYLHFEKEPDLALGYLLDLYNRYPNNSYFRRLYIRSLFELDRMHDVLTAISESLDHPFKPGTHETLTMREDLLTIRGQIRYHYQFDYSSAKSDFLHALEYAEQLTPFAERSNLITSLYYLGQISVREGKRDMARFYFRRAATPDTDHPYAKRSKNALRTHRL